MIEVSGLTKFYGQRKAIDNLTFSVSKGEVLGFLGPNGAGKTTTMKILTGFMPASSGTARVAGFDVHEQALEVKKRIGYLPENPPVYRDMIVSDYLEYAGQLNLVPKERLKKAVDDALEKCNLGNVRGRLIGNLSKGYRQRVGLAQAILPNPDVLILDEPTVGLDPNQIIEIRDLIKQLGGSHTVVLSTHILPEVEAVCSRVLIINEGHIVAIDTLEAISSSLRGGSDVELIVRGSGSESLGEKFKTLPGVLGVVNLGGKDGGTGFRLQAGPKDDIRAQVSQTVFQSGAALLELRRSTVSLEQVFVRLTTDDAATREARQ